MREIFRSPTLLIKSHDGERPDGYIRPSSVEIFTRRKDTDGVEFWEWIRPQDEFTVFQTIIGLALQVKELEDASDRREIEIREQRDRE